MINLNLDSVQESAGGFERPGAGAYVMKVITVTDEPSKQYVKAYLDYAEGKFKGYGEETEVRTSQAFGYVTVFFSYKPSAKGFLKRNIMIIDADNPKKNVYKRFNDGDESCLKGAFVCIVVGEEEYKKKDGTIGKRLTLPQIISSKDFRAGNFTVPELKKLAVEPEPIQNSAAPSESDIAYEDVPF